MRSLIYWKPLYSYHQSTLNATKFEPSWHIIHWFNSFWFKQFGFWTKKHWVERDLNKCTSALIWSYESQYNSLLSSNSFFDVCLCFQDDHTTPTGKGKGKDKSRTGAESVNSRRRSAKGSRNRKGSLVVTSPPPGTTTPGSDFDGQSSTAGDMSAMQEPKNPK